jgi:hypothetical protein
MKRRCAAMRSLATSIDSGALGTHEPSAGTSAALDKTKSWSMDRREGPAPCISNSGEEMNEEQHGHEPRLGVRIIVGPSKRSNPRGVVATDARVATSWARDISNARTTVPVDLHTSTHVRRIAERIP